jgi:hypothetical protein
MIMYTLYSVDNSPTSDEVDTFDTLEQALDFMVETCHESEKPYLAYVLNDLIPVASVTVMDYPKETDGTVKMIVINVEKQEIFEVHAEYHMEKGRYKKTTARWYTLPQPLYFMPTRSHEFTLKS